MNKLIEKFESPQRVAELAPANTMAKIGIKPGETFCDLGAGTGIFIKEALKLKLSEIFAVDISEGMRQILTERFEGAGVKVLDDINRVPQDSCDLVLLSTVFHELDDRRAMLDEINRIIKCDGRVAIIEFRPTKIRIAGPPLDQRISEKQLVEIMRYGKLNKISAFSLSENLFCHIYRR